MTIKFSVPLACLLAIAGSVLGLAQQPDTMPKVIDMHTEFLKPGTSGAAHDRAESSYVDAMAQAKWPTYYVALTSLSGKSRVLYLTGYDSFGSWEKTKDAYAADAKLVAGINRAQLNDGDLLSESDSTVLYYQKDQSYDPVADLSRVRFVEITTFRIRVGQKKDWNDLEKMIVDLHRTTGSTANWANYEVLYGAGDEYLQLSFHDALDAIDKNFIETGKFHAAVGDPVNKKLRDLEAQIFESAETELYEINPRQSYPPPKWIKENPSFWNLKAATESAHKPTP